MSATIGKPKHGLAKRSLASIVTSDREVERALRSHHGFILHAGFVFQNSDSRQIVFHLLESSEHALSIGGRLSVALCQEFLHLVRKRVPSGSSVGLVSQSPPVYFCIANHKPIGLPTQLLGKVLGSAVHAKRRGSLTRGFRVRKMKRPESQTFPK
jgi:hypothetical protein